MSEKTYLRVFVLFLFLLVVMSLSTATFAAMTLTPVVPGYTSTSSAGSYSAAAGSYSYSAANGGYTATASATVSGKTITMPANLRMAANAGQYAKNAMRLNPYAIVGTLAAGWLLDQGLQWLEDQQEWGKQVSVDGQYYFDKTWKNGFTTSGPGGVNYCHFSVAVGCTAETAAREAHKVLRSEPVTSVVQLSQTSSSGSYRVSYVQVSTGNTLYNDISVTPHGSPVPSASYDPVATGDWDSLPDPLSAVGPELPNAPYMSEGAPVDAPDYDFAPYQTPLGEPYTKPDGSTAQPMASISPNGDSITVDTYDQPLTDSNGDPVNNPAPQDTPEPTPDHCQQNPSSLGCAQFGDIPSPDVLPSMTIPASTTVVPIGGAGSCPADVVTTKFGLTWSYQPICDFADAVRPFIIGFAWLGFAYIVAGTVRT